MANPKTLRIVELRVSNIARVKVVHITPDGDLVKIQGRNAQGKSSVIRSIAMALGGKSEFPDEPLRRGAKEGEIVAKLGRPGEPVAFVIRRTFTDAGREALSLTDGEGVPVTGPQTFLDGLIGLGYAFDPIEFARAEPKAQAEMLRRLTGLDFTDLERAREKAYQSRTLANRDVASAKARLAKIPAPQSGLPEKPIAATDLANAATAALEKQYENDAIRKRLEEQERAIALRTSERDKAAAALEAAEIALDKAAKAGEEFRTLVAGLVDPNLEDLKARMNKVEETNAAIRNRDAYTECERSVTEAAGIAEKLTAEIDRIDAEKLARIAAAKMPVPGLGFDAEGLVTLNGLPFAQASQAERLRVSTSIAVAGNAKAKIALVTNGNDLDSANLAALAEIVSEAGATCWIERVTDGDGDGFVIEDGMVKAAPASTAKPEASAP